MLRIIKLLFLYIAYQLSFYSISTGVYMIVENGSLQMSELAGSSTNIMVIMVSQFLSTLALGIHLLVGGYVNKQDLKMSSHNKILTLLLAIVFVLGMSMWTNYFSEMAELPDNMEFIFSSMMNNPLGIASIVILAPIVEELMFRGAIQGYLINKYGRPYVGIVVSSLIFGLIHANPAQVPFAFILGIALGWMYYITGSLLPGMLMHFVNNGSAVLLSYIYDTPDASMTSCFGETGAIVIAVSGIVISALSVWLIHKNCMKSCMKSCTLK